jgi:hypothetical protein
MGSTLVKTQMSWLNLEKEPSSYRLSHQKERNVISSVLEKNPMS